jgi:hypothetical protein
VGTLSRTGESGAADHIGRKHPLDVLPSHVVAWGAGTFLPMLGAPFAPLHVDRLSAQFLLHAHIAAPQRQVSCPGFRASESSFMQAQVWQAASW